MKIILLSGGSGKRLWPLSNDTRSKQFLKVLQNEACQPESMVQRIWRQLVSAGFVHSTYISTNKTQVDIIQNQLGHNAQLIVEPEKRDTFPAIALASVFLFSVLNVKLDEVICVLPVDLYVDDSFFKLFGKIESSIVNSNASLSLVGVKPTYPSENYGYIIPDQNPQNAERTEPYININHIIEKPDPQTAQELIEQNALWNCGVFAFRLGFMIKLLSEKKVPLQYHQLLKRYSILPQISFDYQVVEKANSIIAIPYDGIWSDLGTWHSLTNRMNSTIIGQGVITGQSNNTHLINELEIPVIINGISNSIVALSPDGMLVSDKSASHQIKELVTSLHQRPMYEEKRWGSYRVLDYGKIENGDEVLTKRLKIKAGENLSYQFHDKRKEVWTIISGKGELIIDGQFRGLKAGDVICIPKKARHSARAISDLEFIEVQMGSELIEEDIIRIHLSWEEIEKSYRKSE